LSVKKQLSLLKVKLKLRQLHLLIKMTLMN